MYVTSVYDLEQDWENDLIISKSLSSKTVDVYKQVINLYLHYCLENNFEIEKYNVVIDFFAKLTINKRTMLKYISAFNSFFTFCLKEKIVQENPIEKLDKIKAMKRIVFGISENSVLDFLDNIDTNIFLGLRDKLMFTFLYYSGLRVSELVNIKTQDIDEITGIATVLGKRNKMRRVPLNSKTLKLLLTYKEKERKKLDTKNSKYLFLSQRGEKLTRNEVWYRIKKYSKNRDERWTPHVMRHSFATTLLKKGCPIVDIKDMLGHSSVATTQIYADVNDVKLKSEYLRVFENLGNDKI